MLNMTNINQLFKPILRGVNMIAKNIFDDTIHMFDLTLIQPIVDEEVD